MVARRAHNPKVIGSSPIPATKKSQSSDWDFQFNTKIVEWPSGLRRTLGKRVEVQISRGFESLLHYKHHSCPEGWLFFWGKFQTRLKTQPRKIDIRA